MRLPVGCVVLSLGVTLAFGSGKAQEASQTIFKLGQFDRASSEFHGGEPHGSVSVNADEPGSEKNWYATQPAAPQAGSAQHDSQQARVIDFELPSAPAATYRLHVAVILETRAMPYLRIAINGKPGNFYLDSPLHSKLGTMDDSFQTTLVPADVNIDIQGRDLRRGSNRISIQVIQSGAPTGLPESITYDAIELSNVDGAPEASAPEASISPTVFYRQSSSGLEEELSVFVRDAGSKETSSLRLSLGGREFTAPLSERGEFGERRATLWVPEFQRTTSARLFLEAGNSPVVAGEITPAKKWTVLLVPHNHLDIGYSDYQPKVGAIQSRVLDEAMDDAEKTPGFRYSTDGFWSVEQFWNTRSEADRSRLVAAIKAGTISVPAEYANILTGFPTGEVLIRSLYPSANFSREHGTPFDYADIADVPSYSWSYASVLSSAGVPYFIAGPNGHETRAPVLLQGRLNERSPFWWEGPDGKKVLFWYARHYMEMEIFFGRPPLTSAAYQTLPILLGTYERSDYHASSVLVFGAQQENTELDPGQATFAAQWNSQYAYPHLEYAGFHEALAKIAAEAGDDLPVVRGDGGPYWEDGIASDARSAAMERENERRAPAAEQLATVAAVINPRFAADKPNLDRMWRQMVLADEHTFTSHDAWSDPTSDEAIRQSQLKQLFVADTSSTADYVSRQAMSNIASMIPVDRGNLVVFNTLSWTRSAPVLFDLPHGNQLVDSVTGKPVLTEVLGKEQTLDHVRFVADDVPGNGYKVFHLQRDVARPDTSSPDSTPKTVLDGRFYRVTLDPASGSIQSIFDKELKRELVDQANSYRFGQYIYVSGGDRRPNTLLQYRNVPILPPLAVTGANSGRIVSTARVADGWVARLESTAPNTPKITTEIRLPDDKKAIEIVAEFDKNYVRTREGIYFAFPFAMDHPGFQYEIPNGVVNPAKDMYPGAGHVWFSMQHWVAVQQDGLSATVMPLDAGLVTLGDIHRGVWPEQFGTRQGTIFSWVMNNYWSTNYPAGQGGHFRFRYVITSAIGTDPSKLSRMGWDEATPLETDEITRQDSPVRKVASTLSTTQQNLLSVSDPDVLVQAWKPAEDGRGDILRLLDLGGTERAIKVEIPIEDITRVNLADAVERDKASISVSGTHNFEVTIHPHEMLTVRVLGRPSQENGKRSDE